MCSADLRNFVCALSLSSSSNESKSFFSFFFLSALNFRCILNEVTFVFELFIHSYKENNCFVEDKLRKELSVEFMEQSGTVFGINSRNVYPPFDGIQLDGCGF